MVPPDPAVGTDALSAVLDERLWALNHRFLNEVPDAAHLTDGGALDRAYYIRHRIETIKRIRMTARTDALALAALVDTDYEAARVWARYACEELDHDRMFYDDLAKHGVTRTTVDATPPLPATTELGRFLEKEVVASGPLAAIAYSVFVEWNSERFSRRAVQKAGEVFGEDFVRGSSDHLAVDEVQDHSDEMISLARRLCSAEGGEERLLHLIDRIAGHFRRYFAELASHRGQERRNAA